MTDTTSNDKQSIHNAIHDKVESSTDNDTYYAAIATVLDANEDKPKLNKGNNCFQLII